MATAQELQVAKRIAIAVFDSIKAAGPTGIGSSYLYLAMSEHGCSQETYNTILVTLKQIGAIRQEGHRLIAIEGIRFE